MLKEVISLLLFIAMLVEVSAEQCSVPSENISKSLRLCSDAFDFPNGVHITSDDIVLDCQTAVFRGNYFNGRGITIEDKSNVTLKNCVVMLYEIGLFLRNVSNSSFISNTLLKNKHGVRMIDSADNFFSLYDVSLKKPVKLTQATGNVISAVNKNFHSAEECSANTCVPSKEQPENVIATKKQRVSLFQKLRSFIKSWLSS